MTYPFAVGHPDYSSTGDAGLFIPQLWAGKVIVKWYDSTLLPKITNSDYEGQIRKQGDTLILRSIASVTIEDHNIGDTFTYERPTSTPVTMLVDKGKRWRIALDDVIKVQSDQPLLNQWTDDAGQQMKISIETSFFADTTISTTGPDSHNRGIAAGAKSASFNLGAYGSSQVQITDANVLDYIVDCGTVLDEANVPEQGRWFVIPSWFAGLIKKSDLKDASFSGDSGNPTLRQGRLGMIDRFTIYSSNLLKHSGTSYYAALFGVNAAVTFATQITETEKLRNPFAFEDLVRGLQVYGYKVVKPEGLGCLACYK
jgi:hypothetical protein